MRRTLLLTNDFPPRTGGIQSYLQELATRLPADRLVVYAPAWAGAAEFDAAQPFRVVRHPTSLMLPTPDVARRAAALLAEHDLSAVWFGAAAPLALLGKHLRSAGAERVLASTHGHEVGWSMVPGGRRALRLIAGRVDVVTYVSDYARRRFAAAFGPDAAFEYVPPGVDATAFTPDPVARQRLRERYGLGQDPVVVCVSRMVPRKGQDRLIEALPLIRSRVPRTRLLLVGDGRRAAALTALAERLGLADAVTLTGRVPADELADHYGVGDVFAMPCRTRGLGLDVEGLGIVFLEASAAAVPVVAGDSGGAPETVIPGVTGLVVDGRRVDEVAVACGDLLANRPRAVAFGSAGRDWVTRRWTWDHSAELIRGLLST
jgi:phosphatidyl-myo-inositol dimannoside synthase